MDVATALSQLGGEASPKTLRAWTSRGAVARALAAREVLRLRQGVIGLPLLDEALAAARDAHGARSHLNAALVHGWAVKSQPGLPTVTVPRNRKLSAKRRAGMRVVWGPLTDDELERRVTSRVRTVIDCARDLPFDQALTVADSALRSGVTAEELRAAALASARTGRSRVLSVLAVADGRAANPFESVLRAIALGVPGLVAEPQVQIGDARVDLADPELRLVLEADSWEFHGTRDGFQKDVRRYTELVRERWVVLRFLWEDVMDQPDYVHDVLTDVVRRCQREGSSLTECAS